MSREPRAAASPHGVDDGRGPLPRPWPDTAFFWTSGADGRLRVQRCRSCGRLQHPPSPHCGRCGADDIEPAPLSGEATLWSFSVVHQPFIEWLETPYVLGIVSLHEDPDVRLTTRIVGCAPEAVEIGMPLRVRFEARGELYLPLFEPRR